MATLAIKGHATRGKEVIEILEMLGGKNTEDYYSTNPDKFYIIVDGEIVKLHHRNDCTTYTLEEFLEKFPYKVGDRVKKANDDDGYGATVICMDWDSGMSEVIYTIIFDDHIGSTLECLSVNLQPYKEETFGECIEKTIDICLFGKQETTKEQTYLNNKANKEKEKIKESLKDAERIMEEQIKIYIPKGYKFAGVDDDNKQVVFEKIGCQYPKTYEECCEVLDILGNINIEGYKKELLLSLQKLLICRNAYWKLYDEQMGLRKPWSPSKNNSVYCIFRLKGEIIKDNFVFADSLILEFPTEEMRDAFYENFKDLIEQCKELL